ncbi:MAG: hypothetical protein WCA48_27130 [Pseudomonas gingeri]
MMHRLLLMIIAILCSACARVPSQPQAKLTYHGIERRNNAIYTISYSSDIDLLNVFSRADGEGQLATMLICSLDGDPVFSAEHVIEKKFEGVIGISGKTPGPPFAFKTEGTLNVTHNGGTSSKLLSKSELQYLLHQRQEVICKAFITVFGYKAYYSKPMLVPSADIIREVNKDLSN